MQERTAYAESGQDIRIKEHGGWSEELARRVFNGSGYERSLLVPNGLLSKAEMRTNFAEFNRRLICKVTLTFYP